MKDTLPEEEEEMRSHNWDLEDVRFGPPSERYKQPSLISRTAEHTRVLREAEGIRRKVEAFNSGAAVRPAAPGHVCCNRAAAQAVSGADLMSEWR